MPQPPNMNQMLKQVQQMQAEMLEADGKVHITCEYCSKTFFVGL